MMMMMMMLMMIIIVVIVMFVVIVIIISFINNSGRLVGFIGCSNNQFNNLRFRTSLETNTQLHVSDTITSFCELLKRRLLK